MKRAALNLDFKTDILPFVAATTGEFIALYFWLQFLDAGWLVAANVVLWIGFAVERAAVYLWIRYIYRQRGGGSTSSLPLVVGGLLAITLSEVLIWMLWLVMADGGLVWLGLSTGAGFVLAAVVLMGLMLIEHSVEMAALRRTPLLAYVTNANTVFFTLMEVAGAVGWLLLVRNGHPLLGGLCLLVGLSVEHVLQGSQLRPEEAPPRRAPLRAS